ncbi:hypothetical protein HMN09_00387600 [Mycena chlorophos]|uniref:Transmembrane protein n=1 Tax=Mycena chlorophos TaxID=658473 RepID=A0A8H6WL61_MYCCL|nr:hypothetical protein HMN09_00387600 [Mycena chlorophos]
MPTTVGHKIDVTSPLIHYIGSWVRGGSKKDPAGEFADPDQPRYDEETFVFCDPGSQCTASFDFRGTEVHFVGAYRSNRGPVSFTLDGQDFGPYTVSTNPQQFQVEYFNGTGLLEDGIHTVSAVNAISNNLTYDLDYITWTSTVNSTVDTRFQDDCAAFSYQPAHAWSVDLGNMTGFDDGTGHVGSMGSSATLKFSGDRVAVYGAIGAQGAPFTAQLDGGSSTAYTQRQSISDTPSEDYLPSQLIYYADGLSDGNHTLVLSSASNSSGLVFTIDYALVDGTVNQPPETTGTNATTSVPAPISVPRGPNTALGVVSAIAGFLLVVVVVLIVYIVRLRRIVADLRFGYLGATPVPREPEGSWAGGNSSSFAPTVHHFVNSTSHGPENTSIPRNAKATKHRAGPRTLPSNETPTTTASSETEAASVVFPASHISPFRISRSAEHTSLRNTSLGPLPPPYMPVASPIGQ